MIIDSPLNWSILPADKPLEVRVPLFWVFKNRMWSPSSVRNISNAHQLTWIQLRILCHVSVGECSRTSQVLCNKYGTTCHRLSIACKVAIYTHLPLSSWLQCRCPTDTHKMLELWLHTSRGDYITGVLPVRPIAHTLCFKVHMHTLETAWEV